MEELTNLIYEHIGPDESGYILGRLLRPILVKSSLDTKTLARIWSLVDTEKSGKVTKAQLTTILKLISLAQKKMPLSLETTDIDVPIFQNLDVLKPTTQSNNDISNETDPKIPKNEARADDEESQQGDEKRTKLKYKDFVPVEFKKGGFFIRNTERFEPLTDVLSRAKDWMDDIQASPTLRKKFKILHFQTMFVDYNEHELFKDHSYVEYTNGQVQIVRVFYEQLV